MNFYQGLAVILLRVWAAEIIFMNAATAPYYLSTLFDRQGNVSGQEISAVAFAVGYFASGLVFWFLAPPLARFFGARLSAPPPSINLSVERVVEIGTFLVGFYYLFSNVPEFVMNVASLLYQVAKQTDSDRLYGGITFRGTLSWEIWTSAATAAIALFLTFRPRDIARLFTWLREAGLPPAEEATPAETMPPKNG